MNLLKECCKKIDALKPYADEMRTIRVKAVELADFRDTFAHGCLASFDRGTGIYRFVMADTNDADQFHYVKAVPVTLFDLRAATLEAMELTRLTHLLTNRLMDAFVR